MKDWRDEAYELSKKQWNKQSIADSLQMPRKTVSDFLNRRTHKGWWEDEVGELKPKVLLFDIETAPFRAVMYGRFKQFIGPSQVEDEGYVMSFAAKWLGDDNMMYHANVSPEDDKMTCELLWNLLDQADAVIAHNLIGFDHKVMNTRFVYHDMLPPSNYKLIDTLQIAKKYFKFPSNSLESVAKYLKLPVEKMKVSMYELWRGFVAGDLDCVRDLELYNKKDVEVLEEVYFKIRAWDKQHPNLALFYEDPAGRCGVCGGTDFVPYGVSTTGMGVYHTYQCECGKIMKDRKRVNNLEGVLVNG